MKKLNIYIASSFFSDAGFTWTARLADCIRHEFGSLVELYVPQENGEINDKEGNDANIKTGMIFQADMDALKKSDMIIANLDGVEIDPGVAFELGAVCSDNLTAMRELEKLQKCIDVGAQVLQSDIDYWSSKIKSVIGIVTDMRWQGTGRNSLYRNLLVIDGVELQGTLVEGYAGDENRHLSKVFEIINNELIDRGIIDE